MSHSRQGAKSQWSRSRGGATKRSGLKARSGLLIARLFSSVADHSAFRASDFSGEFAARNQRSPRGRPALVR